MIPNGLFTQIGLVLLSIGIIMFYISPAFDEISTAQDQIAVYQRELGQVSAVNANLQAKLQQIDQISATDRDRLLVYMPDSVDVLSVMRDIEAAVDQSGTRLVDINNNGPLEETTESREARRVDSPTAAAQGPHAHVFALTTEGTYSQTKELIEALENNHYPLEVQRLLLSVSEGGFIEATMDVYTYSQYPTEVPDVRLYQDINVTYD